MDAKKATREVQNQIILQVDNLRRMVREDFGIKGPNNQAAVVGCAMLRVALNMLAVSIDMPLERREEFIKQHIGAVHSSIKDISRHK